MPAETGVAPATTPYQERTRLKAPTSSGLSFRIALVSAVVLSLSAILAHWYGSGATATITCNAPGAHIVLNGYPNFADAGGNVELKRLDYGSARLVIQHPDYEPLDTNVHLSWLGTNRFRYDLKPIPATVRIDTLPGATVYLNGREAGRANGQGRYLSGELSPGEYDIEVKLAGYSPYVEHRRLRAGSTQVWTNLNPTAERLRQVEAEQQKASENAAQVQRLFSAAQQRFASRQYNAALESVNQALRLDPANAGALQLRDQIVQTMSILK